ncbi:hypothetical protein ACFQL1_14010 [Halomicroarcula sp. GCM10025709]|uniref:hypothetical protein n=1 Tax=Halomicroarcula sp. GCM10025709 TaxID=3252669 RepID=UPI003607ECFB
MTTGRNCSGSSAPSSDRRQQRPFRNEFDRPESEPARERARIGVGTQAGHRDATDAQLAVSPTEASAAAPSIVRSP